MAGKVAGVQINTTSSDPGQANSVIIRGISSINGNNQPLYVVDGVPLVQTTFRGTQKEQDQTIQVSCNDPYRASSKSSLSGC